MEDERSKRKEQLLQVAQRVQSEYSFKYVASGSESQEDLSGLSSTDEYVSLSSLGFINLACHVLLYCLLKFKLF